MLDFDDETTYSVLLEVCRTYKTDPSASIESETFFRSLLAEYIGEADILHIRSWLSEALDKRFIALRERPKWIQGYDWPFVDGEPMIFVDQLDIEPTGTAAKLFHDSTSFYVFISRRGPPKTIVQQH